MPSCCPSTTFMQIMAILTPTPGYYIKSSLVRAIPCLRMRLLTYIKFFAFRLLKLHSQISSTNFYGEIVAIDWGVKPYCFNLLTTIQVVQSFVWIESISETRVWNFWIQREAFGSANLSHPIVSTGAMCVFRHSIIFANVNSRALVYYSIEILGIFLTFGGLKVTSPSRVSKFFNFVHGSKVDLVFVLLGAEQANSQRSKLSFMGFFLIPDLLYIRHRKTHRIIRDFIKLPKKIFNFLYQIRYSQQIFESEAKGVQILPSNQCNFLLNSLEPYNYNKRMTQKKINNYLIFLQDVLGKGSFGSVQKTLKKVYRGQQDKTKLTVAVKVLQKSTIDRDEYLKAALFSEIQILQLLKSDNVVRVFDVMQSSHNYYIIQELCDSDLQHFLSKTSRLQETEAIDLLKQICNGFMALVKQGIVHRDLKPANLMLCKGVIKIGDFGFAKKNVSNRMKIATSVGTPLYMSPQVLKSEPYTSKCDVWATGFIFYEMLHGKTPWTAHSEFELVKNIETKPLIIDESISQNAKDFLRRTLALTQEDRLSWDEVFLHPIFNGAFHQFAQENQQFENKLKAVMSQLRFQVNSKNIDLCRLIQNLGFQDAKQLEYKQFQRFIRHIHPNLTRQEIRFFFEKLDEDADGNVSINELAFQMEKHRISFSKLSPELHKDENSFKVKKTESQECFQNKKMSTELEIRVKKCFVKLYSILTTKKITLYRTFQAFDISHTGSLNVNQFEKILLKMDAGFTRKDVEEVFDYVDTDKSKSVEFSELRSFYCKINGIPETLQDPDFHSSSKSNSHSHSHHEQHSSHSRSRRHKIFQQDHSIKD